MVCTLVENQIFQLLRDLGCKIVPLELKIPIGNAW